MRVRCAKRRGAGFEGRESRQRGYIRRRESPHGERESDSNHHTRAFVRHPCDGHGRWLALGAVSSHVLSPPARPRVRRLPAPFSSRLRAVHPSGSVASVHARRPSPSPRQTHAFAAIVHSSHPIIASFAACPLPIDMLMLPSCVVISPRSSSPLGKVTRLQERCVLTLIPRPSLACFLHTGPPSRALRET